MTEPLFYTFKIDGFTPESMPFRRLVKYYEKIEKLLGLDGHLHLIGIKQGSHASAFAIDRRAETELNKRFLAIRTGRAPREVHNAIDEINDLLAVDETSGALLGPSGGEVIAFPGRLREEGDSFKITARIRVIGELYSVTGDENGVDLRLRTDAWGVVRARVSGDVEGKLRQKLKRFLFEQVEASGSGVWRREEMTSWKIGEFDVDHIAPVKEQSLRETIDRIRNLGLEWPDSGTGIMRSDDEDEKDGEVIR